MTQLPVGKGIHRRPCQNLMIGETAYPLECYTSPAALQPRSHARQYHCTIPEDFDPTKLLLSYSCGICGLKKRIGLSSVCRTCQGSPPLLPCLLDLLRLPDIQAYPKRHTTKHHNNRHQQADNHKPILYNHQLRRPCKQGTLERLTQPISDIGFLCGLSQIFVQLRQYSTIS